MIHSGTFLVPRQPDEVFDLLATPERFAPLLPDYESMTMQDATHFVLRTAVALGRVNGHANLAMELKQTKRPIFAQYAGEGVVAGSCLKFGVSFRLAAENEATRVDWQGEVTLQGMLAQIAGALLDTQGRHGFERMADRLQGELRSITPDTQPPEFP